MRQRYLKHVISGSGCFLVCAVWIFTIKVIWQVPSSGESFEMTEHSSENDLFRERIFLKNDKSENLNRFPGISKFSSDVMKRRTGRILWYRPPNFQHIIDSEKIMDFSKCGFPNTCTHVINDTLISSSDAVIFHGSVLPVVLPKRRKDQFWIFYTLESPPSVYPIGNNWRREFDWMMSYRRDSQIFLPYGKIFQNENRDKLDFNNILRNKVKESPVAWLVSNCHARNKRNEYVNEMKKHVRVEVFGRCGTPIMASFANTSIEAYKILSLKHKFYLSFENNHCTDYITEKLFNTYSRQVPLIPVVRGAASYTEILPNGTYINTADFKTPKDLANYLNYLNDNDDAYLKILREKLKYDVYDMVEVYHQSLCRICEKIQNPMERVRTNRTDVSSWIRDNTCTTVNGI
ncbi:glycoprotein 3-alpha-L-fucosyltransferase A-like [Ylistrum balloti]|uniref:glycoprotein 3-alpha-L-fucosyltransferase A-like n=1 Tax=Ylistrum balloti TaxID=509963 RepID=UPI002905A17A|nr:glycoprotein 3-alpha-L-fucosyltransferase A-like [Ylistrum balloti]